MRVKTYELVAQCVETGVALGIRRAHKHTDAPTREDLEREVVRAILGEFDVWFEFETSGERQN